MKKVVYPGTFDPITLGHVNIIERGLKIFDVVIVAVAKRYEKNPLFTVEERVELIKEAFKGNENVVVKSFDGLLIDFVKAEGVKVILRGLRTVADFEYELQMALANKKMHPDIETIFMMTEGNLSYFSSSLIKEIASLGGCIKGMVPSNVEKAVMEKCKKLNQGKF